MTKEAQLIAILNGFGRTLGDGLIGLQALHIALAEGVIPELPVLFRLPGLSPVLQDLYALAEFAEVRDLPWEKELHGSGFEEVHQFSNFIDIRDFAHDPGFRECAMIDYFLCKLGVDPAAIVGERKRNQWLAPRIKAVANKMAGEPYVLLCPQASIALRCMPLAIQDEVIEWVRSNTSYKIVMQTYVGTLRDLCSQVANASLVISTDTAIVHFADSFSVPCVGFYTTHQPEWRMRDYPLCQGVHLPLKNAPPALEFARGRHDVDAAEEAWFPQGSNFSWMHQILSKSVGQKKRGAR